MSIKNSSSYKAIIISNFGPNLIPNLKYIKVVQLVTYIKKFEINSYLIGNLFMRDISSFIILKKKIK